MKKIRQIFTQLTLRHIAWHDKVRWPTLPVAPKIEGSPISFGTCHSDKCTENIKSKFFHENSKDLLTSDFQKLSIDKDTQRSPENSELQLLAVLDQW